MLVVDNHIFLAFDHSVRGKGLGRLRITNPWLRRAGAAVLRAIHDDRLELHVSSGWVLLPPDIAAALSPLSFILEKRVLNRYPIRELPVRLRSTGYTWSQIRGFRRVYRQTHAEPGRIVDDW
jgi:hypothetical protein